MQRLLIPIDFTVPIDFTPGSLHALRSSARMSAKVGGSGLSAARVEPPSDHRSGLVGT